MNRTHLLTRLAVGTGLLLAGIATASGGGPRILIRTGTPDDVGVRAYRPNNGTRAENVAAREGEPRYYRVHVSRDIRRLEIATDGGRGNADLYVRHGRRPTRSTYDRRSTYEGNGDRVTLDNPRDGWWYVMLYPERRYYGLDLRIRKYDDRRHRDDEYDDRYDDRRRGRILRNGEIRRGIDLRRGTYATWRVYVPRDTDRLVVRTRGYSGDADLYVRHAGAPDRHRYDYRSTGYDSDERITVPRPTEGTWYVAVHAYRAVRDLEIVASHDGGRYDYDDRYDRRYPRRPRHPRDRRYEPPRRDVRRTVDLLSPDGGETFSAGQRITVRWRAGRSVRRVRVQYSYDNGRTWIVPTDLRDTIDADRGSASFRLPRVIHTQENFRIRVADRDNAGNADVSGRIRLRGERDENRRRRYPRRRATPRSRSGAPGPTKDLDLGVTRRYALRAGASDRFRFAATRGGTYTLRMPSATAEFEAEVTVRDARGRERRGEYDDIEDGWRKTLRVPRGGAIVVLLRPEDDEAARYSLRLDRR